MNYLLLFITLISQLNYQQSDLQCKDYKTGTFELIDKEMDKSYWIKRTETLQSETLVGSNDTSTYEVKWTGDCEYELRVLTGNKEVMDFYKDRVLNIEIVDTYDDGYEFRGTVEGIDREFSQRLTVIEE
jgi:hypothetical protein